MKKEYQIWSVVAALFIFVVAALIHCHILKGRIVDGTTLLHRPLNSVYYWRTDYYTSDYDTHFLKANNVGRMYVRMFDVVEGFDQPEPNATITFSDNLPDNIEIVPTVFITVEALRQASEQKNINTLAQKIVKRVNAISAWNGIKNCKELQLDCDWTSTTRDAFYKLCFDVKHYLGKGKLLSCTIRLHQLQQTPPCVDYGVLMVYNVGNFKDPNEKNSILDSKTVEKYLTRKLKCNLPLDIALPAYQWDLMFDNNNNFMRICYRGERPDEGCKIKHEEVSYDEIIKVKNMLNRYLHLQKGEYSTIIYHLEEYNLNKYSDEQIKDIYNR